MAEGNWWDWFASGDSRPTVWGDPGHEEAAMKESGLGSPSEPDPGTLTKAFANPWIAGAYGLGSGLLAASAPYRGTREIARGIGQGVEMGLAAEKGDYERAKQQRMSEAMRGMIGATTPGGSVQASPATIALSRPDEGPAGQDQDINNEMRMSDAARVQVSPDRPRFTPQQQAVLNAAVSGGRPEIAFNALAAQAFKEPKPPLVVRPGGAIWDPDTGTFSAQLPALPKEPTFRPYQIDLGDKVESGQVNAATGEKIGVTITPKGAAPAREMTPEQKAKVLAETDRARAQAGHAAALAERARNITKMANDPNTAKEKLATELSVALRDQKNAREAGDEEALAAANIVVSELRQALARRAKERNQGQVMEDMPDPKANKGRTIRDTKTGVRMKSDGKNWVPIEGGGEY